MQIKERDALIVVSELGWLNNKTKTHKNFFEKGYTQIEERDALIVVSELGFIRLSVSFLLSSNLPLIIACLFSILPSFLSAFKTSNMLTEILN